MQSERKAEENVKLYVIFASKFNYLSPSVHYNFAGVSSGFVFFNILKLCSDPRLAIDDKLLPIDESFPHSRIVSNVLLGFHMSTTSTRREG